MGIMMNKIRDEDGLTLVEMLVSITLMGIICTAIIGVTFTAFRSYNESKNSTQEIQQVRLAMEYIVRELRVAQSATPAGSTLTYRSWVNTTDRSIYLDADNYLHLNNEGTDRRLIRSKIQAFTCSFNPSDNRIMDITIAVSRSTSLTSSVQMLNINRR
jgi:Tfp pilus assembly protein PilV